MVDHPGHAAHSGTHVLLTGFVLDILMCCYCEEPSARVCWLSTGSFIVFIVVAVLRWLESGRA